MVLFFLFGNGICTCWMATEEAGDGRGQWSKMVGNNGLGCQRRAGLNGGWRVGPTVCQGGSEMGNGGPLDRPRLGYPEWITNSGYGLRKWQRVEVCQELQVAREGTRVVGMTSSHRQNVDQH